MAEAPTPAEGEVPEPDESVPASYPADPQEPSLPPGTDAGATKALAGFLKLTPFLDLHQKAGGDAGHRFRGWLCFALEMVLRAVVIGLLLAIIVTVAWKTLTPIPWADCLP
jgi:hypothetical protein